MLASSIWLDSCARSAMSISWELWATLARAIAATSPDDDVCRATSRERHSCRGTESARIVSVTVGARAAVRVPTRQLGLAGNKNDCD